VKLAELFGVSKQAASEWGRVRAIPRHVRPRLEEVVRQRASGADVDVQRTLEDPWQILRSLITGTGLMLVPPPDEDRSSKGRGTWRAMTEEDRTVLFKYVRQAGLIAMALQQLLSHVPARRVITTLNEEVNTHVNNELLRRRRLR
jgi:hypothetical protein